MVDRGQFLERMTVIERAGDVLEGLYQAGGGGLASPVLMLSGVPAAGGTMEHAVLAELAWQLSRAGHPTLRFNYARRDDEQPRPVALTLEDLNRWLAEPAYVARFVDDAHRALDHLVATHEGAPVAAVGLGLGAWLALRLLERPEVVTAGLVAPSATPALYGAAPPDADVFALLPEHGAAIDRQALAAVLGAEVPVDVVRDADPAFVRGLSELGMRVTARVAA
jgi:alpha/beta superfamily hydrolase